MTDFHSLRAMFLRNGVDPNALGNLSLGELHGMIDALAQEGKDPLPSEEESMRAFDAFAALVSKDSSVKLG